jgi:RHS repeat-associated protein
MTDSSSTEVNSYDYDPSGQVSNLTEQSGLNNPFKFAGGYLDSNSSLGSNLYKFGTRYYDPSIGRWTQLDPVDPVGAEYVYAGDNPVNEVDPSGKFSIEYDWGLPFGLNGITLTFTAKELSILANPFLSLPLKVAIGIGVNLLPFPLPEGLGNFIAEELPNSVVYARRQCSQGASILAWKHIFSCEVSQ